MIEVNELKVNGQSTGDFSFPVFVEGNDGFRSPKKKNRLMETDHSTGANKDEVRAWPPIPKEYTIYCPTATLKDMRQIKSWAKDYGQLIASDEPDVFYEILDVELAHSPVDAIAGYRVDIVFTTNPFGYELEQVTNSYTDGQSITNHTNAPMYPHIKVFGESNQQTSITIGNQTVYLKKLHHEMSLESKPLEQNVFDQYGQTANSIMRGDFIEIIEGTTSVIQLGSGITSIEMLERWAWL